MMLMNSDFNSLKANRYKIPSALAEQGMTASTPEVKTIGGHDYITLETYKSGERCIVAFTAVNSSNTALIVAANQDYEIDYSILQKITPIITSATYENSTSNMESPNEFNIDINSITELAQ